MAAPKAAASRFSFGGGGNKCHSCTKTVYANEQILYDSKYYHTTCFKCTKCRTTPTLQNVAMIAGDMFCKPCFKKKFAERGSYNDFGDKTTPNWTKEHRKSVDHGTEPVKVEHHDVGGKLEAVPEKSAHLKSEAKSSTEKPAADKPAVVEKPAEKPVEKAAPEPVKTPEPEAAKAEPESAPAETAEAAAPAEVAEATPVEAAA